MSRDGYGRWDDRPEPDPDAYDPPDDRRPRGAGPTDDLWSPDPRPAGEPYERHGSHRRSGKYSAEQPGTGQYGADQYGADQYGADQYGAAGYEQTAGYPDGAGYSGHPDGYAGPRGGDGRHSNPGLPDTGYPDTGYPDGRYRHDGYPGGSDAGNGYPDAGAPETGYRAPGPGDSGYRAAGPVENGYGNGFRDGGYAGSTERYASPDPYGPPDTYGRPDPYAGRPDPYAGQPDPYAGQPDPYGPAEPYGGQPEPYSPAEPYRAADPYGQPDPYGQAHAPSQTDPFGRTDPYGRTDTYGQAGPPAQADPRGSLPDPRSRQPDPFGAAERYGSQGAYGDDPLGSGRGTGGYDQQGNYGELGSSYGRQDPYGGRDPYGGPAGHDTGDPLASHDPHGQRGDGQAGYAGPAGSEYGGGYDDHDYRPAPGPGVPEPGPGPHEQYPAPNGEYARPGERDERYGRQGPVDETGVTRREREPDDELDPDHARHNGFFRGFGAADDEGGHRPPRKRRSRAGMVALFVIVIFLGGLVGAGAYGYHWYSKRHADWVGSAGYGSVMVKVVPGEVACSTTMENTLVSHGVVASASAFCSAAKANGNASALEPGYFRLHKHMGAVNAWALLISPKSRVQTTVGVPDGLRWSKVLAVLAAKTGYPLSQFEAAIKDTSALGLPSFAKGNPEGFLWPATYDIQPGTTPLAILQMMVKQSTQEMASVNLAARAKAAQFTEYQVIIVASLLEAEVPPQYYAKVARVIDNRLNQRPPWDLGLDSTVAYAVNKYIYNLTQSDLNVNSPYNTTTHAGLPPGPIDSPDLTAINAVLHPAPRTDGSLYFVTVNKQGLTRFTTSSAQFTIWSNEAKANGI